MSGHSKWSQIKRQKGVADTRRGQVFTKLAREIIVAVRQGGDNPDANFRLRLAIQKAREQSMPSDNIERAIRRGSGGTEGATLSEVTLEGYGPSGVAILVEVLTDNRLRTLQEVRATFSRNGGNLGESCVSWLFDTRGVITVEEADARKREELALEAIDAGAEDVKMDESQVEIYTSPTEMEAVKRKLEGNNHTVASAEVWKVAKTPLSLDEKAGLQTLRLLDRLEELDDVQRVFSSADFSDDVLEKYRASLVAGSR